MLGIDYIKIAIANAYGLDHTTWEERMLWVDSERNAWGTLHERVHDAKEPYQFIAGIKALEDAEEGIPTGYIMGLDACSSGIQLMSLLSGDVSGAELSGLIHTGIRRDVHRTIQADVNKVVPNNFTRSEFKQAGMTVMYGSLAAPSNIFGDQDIIDAFYESLENRLPECIKLLNAMIAAHKKDATEYKWTLPDGHVALVKVMDSQEYTIVLDRLENIPFTHRTKENVPKEKDVSLAANIIQSIDAYVVRELGLRCNYDTKALMRTYELLESLHIPRCIPIEPISIVHAYELSASNLLNYTPSELYWLKQLVHKVLLKEPFEQISVHDKFFCSPNNMNVLRDHIKDIYSELARMDLMENILTEIKGSPSGYVKKPSNIAEEILKSEYIIS